MSEIRQKIKKVFIKQSNQDRNKVLKDPWSYLSLLFAR